jgi:hypothetical protein
MNLSGNEQEVSGSCEHVAGKVIFFAYPPVKGMFKLPANTAYEDGTDILLRNVGT